MLDSWKAKGCTATAIINLFFGDDIKMRSVFQCPKCDEIMQIAQKKVSVAPTNTKPNGDGCIKGRYMDLYKCSCGATKTLLSGWRPHHKRYEH
jgi:hypothetical protein